MTLTTDVLDAIESNWPGGFPSDVTRLDRDDSKDIDANTRLRTADLQQANFVTAATDSVDDKPFAARADPAAEAIIMITVQGLHADEHGQLADDDEFRSVVQDVKTALRDERHDPTIGDSHPATWVRSFLEDSAVGSGGRADHYIEVFNLRLVGHY